jgi:ABC-type branched-subunit amino acid transport system substrate-binding protein
VSLNKWFPIGKSEDKMQRTFTYLRRYFNGLILSLFALLLAACDQTAGFNTGARSVDADAQVKVALLVPLESGRSELDFLGSSLVNAARLARGDLAGVELDLQVYPTAGEPGRAQQAIQQAVNNGAQIVIGPLFSTATASVAPIAAQNGLSVLSFSNNSDIGGGNVHLLGLTFDTIADRVVSYAVGQGRTNIAVVHSNDAAGRSGLQAATNAITRFGGSFAGSTEYELSPQGISLAAPIISDQLKASGANAVVFTDDPATGLTFLTPMLANSGLESGSLQYLGLTRWNEPAAAAETPSMQGGVFASADPGTLAQFSARYVATYGTEPHPLAGLAYDGVAAIGAMMRNAQTSGDGRALTREQITDPAGFAGVNGIFRFRTNGNTDRGLALMQLRDGQAVVIDPAPRSFAGGS